MATLPHGRGVAARRAGLFALAVLAATAGCSGRPWVNPPDDLLNRTWVNARPTADAYPNPDSVTVGRLSGAFDPTPVTAPSRPLNVLALSGGGKYGAYTAGVLCGWTANGTRPQFDVVTGISSGALTAILAFLGPKYDARMNAAYTNVTATDLFRARILRGLVVGDALATSEPLEDLIAKNLDAEAMADLRQAHHDGRRLFVATMNVTTVRPVIWDVGALATSGRPDADVLVRKVLLAACSIPAYVPPVEFDVTVNGTRYRELHGDAGSVVEAFVRTANGLPPGSNVYVITSGKVYRDVLENRPRLAGLIRATVSSALFTMYRENVARIHTLCAVSGAKFHLVALSPAVKVKTASMTFDKDELRQLFAVGYQSSVNGIEWRGTPPGTLPAEAPIPRTGLEFVVPGP